jgi:hypothetical protein
MLPGPAPAPITVSPAQQVVLAALLRRASCPQALALRVRLILGAAGGQRNEPLARQLGCTPKTARKWRFRWAAAEAHLARADEDPPALERAIAAALADAPRAGAPATFTAEQIVRIIDLACRPPEHFARPVTAWTPRELAAEAVKQGIVAAISPRSVERFLGRGRPPAAPQPLLAHRQGPGRRS